jgi:hypothetical protein
MNMMNSIRNYTSLVGLILLLVLSTSGCKSKKKAMEAAAAEKARMEQEAIKKQNQEEEAQRRLAAAEKANREEAEARQREIENKASAAPKARLSNYFDAVAGSGNNTASANSSITEALTLFASPEVPVLIVISEEGGQKDYDKPTTIKNYLNYLKDQKKNINTISDLQFDGSGKITELELKKSL